MGLSTHKCADSPFAIALAGNYEAWLGYTVEKCHRSITA